MELSRSDISTLASLIAQEVQSKLSLEPYSMEIKKAAAHFGYTDQALYDKIYNGELIYGTHFLKDGKKILILVKGFKSYLFQKAGLQYEES